MRTIPCLLLFPVEQLILPDVFLAGVPGFFEGSEDSSDQVHGFFLLEAHHAIYVYAKNGLAKKVKVKVTE